MAVKQEEPASQADQLPLLSGFQGESLFNVCCGKIHAAPKPSEISQPSRHCGNNPLLVPNIICNY